VPIDSKPLWGESADAIDTTWQVVQAPTVLAVEEMVMLPRCGFVMRRRARNLDQVNSAFPGQLLENPVNGRYPQRGNRFFPGLANLSGRERTLCAHDHARQRQLLLGRIGHNTTIHPDAYDKQVSIISFGFQARPLSRISLNLPSPAVSHLP
jgi:hypothetical protein